MKKVLFASALAVGCLAACSSEKDPFAECKSLIYEVEKNPGIAPVIKEKDRVAEWTIEGNTISCHVDDAGVMVKVHSNNLDFSRADMQRIRANYEKEDIAKKRILNGDYQWLLSNLKNSFKTGLTSGEEWIFLAAKIHMNDTPTVCGYVIEKGMIKRIKGPRAFFYGWDGTDSGLEGFMEKYLFDVSMEYSCNEDKTSKIVEITPKDLDFLRGLGSKHVPTTC